MPEKPTMCKFCNSSNITLVDADETGSWYLCYGCGTLSEELKPMPKTTELEQLRAQVATLRRLLAESLDYARHATSCSGWLWNYPCKCGYKEWGKKVEAAIGE